ncbi:hypothetical protein [Candidatus Methanoperedens nitratireducens]|uniref:Uncharacterized protein n=1 Tax=Candidatus Methanoperedens nitratireducens TaxID=1392998 RepID=A0A284VK47_9EURY|nr:hypothetical protein [Candidatus Methanoperedens nitroreducens]SNQ59612.1 hypothetical protein MNV_1240010 [Candidatus Methanoperedens nitroreducens]
MIEAIRNTDAKESDKKVKELSERLKPDFEKNLDNDLHIRQAFDGLLHTFSGVEIKRPVFSSSGSPTVKRTRLK